MSHPLIFIGRSKHHSPAILVHARRSCLLQLVTQLLQHLANVGPMPAHAPGIAYYVSHTVVVDEYQSVAKRPEPRATYFDCARSVFERGRVSPYA